jgi:rhodanese-related sulfurtransferase
MKRLRLSTIWVMIGIVIVSSACQSAASATNPGVNQSIGKIIKVEGGSYTDLTVTELQSLLTKKDFTFINVHIPFEGNLPQTNLSIPYDTISQNLGKMPADKNAKIILYCRSGHMSTIAAKELVKHGYTNIWNLDGGMAAWEQAGLKVEK